MLATRPDHVAAVVPDITASLPRWQELLGGATQWDFHNAGRFRGKLLEFNGGARLELLMPSDAPDAEGTLGGPEGFVEVFLARFGPRVHHVTLKVPDLLDAVASLAEVGIEAVDVDTSDDGWHEAFVPPSVVGGVIVQLATSLRSDAEFAELEGAVPETPADDAAVLRGPTLTHTDLDRASEVWTLLGATVEPDGPDALRVGWDGHPLDVRVERGRRADALGVRFAGAGPRPLDPALGPAVLPG